MAAWNDPEPGAPTFQQRVTTDPVITERLPLEQLQAAFDFKRQLGNIDAVFERVLADG